MRTLIVRRLPDGKRTLRVEAELPPGVERCLVVSSVTSFAGLREEPRIETLKATLHRNFQIVYPKIDIVEGIG